MSSPDTPLRLRLQALAGIVGISFSAIFVRLSGTSPTTAAFFRAAYALPLLALLWLPVRHRDGRGTKARLIAVFAGVILGADLAAWHRSIESIGAGLATVLASTQVVFVALVAWWLHGERPRRAAWLALPVMLLGVVLTSGLGATGAYGSDPLRGVAYGVLTAVLYTLFLLVIRSASSGDAPVVGPWLDATAGTLLGVWLLGLLDGGLDYAFAWPAHAWLIALAMVAQVFGWLLITRSMSRMPAVETSILLLAQPMLTVLWGSILLDERLSTLQGAGVALVVAGIGYLSIGAAGTPRAQSGADRA
ncbi:MAG: DMT family transporter [Acidobacteria bacterium]|nr:DMT family transporter [Acidobacteriota bacterium]